MINIFYIFRKENTYIYIILLSFLAIFLSIISSNIKSLDDNKKEYDYYFLLKEDEIKEVSNNDILYSEDCILINNYYLINISDKLKDNEMILAYKLDEESDFVKNNNFKIIDYNENSYISLEKFKEINSSDSYKKIYLKRITDYEKYNSLIEKSDFYSKSIDIEEAKKTMSFFKGLLIVLYIVLFLLICVIIANTIYDNLRNFRMLRLLGYKRKNMIFIIIIQILLMLFVPICILLI